jgi:hypothetical protein
MKQPKDFWAVYISLFVALVCVVLFAVMARWNGLRLNLDPRNVAGPLGPITLAAAFIERAVDVVITHGATARPITLLTSWIKRTGTSP